MYDEIDYINKDIMQEFINSKNSLRQGNGIIYENEIDINPKEQLNALLENLQLKDRQIVSYHLGLEDDMPMTFQMIGEKMSLTKQAVRSRYIKAMKVIKELYEQ